jgi:uncharacterized protein (TIGR03083 family)
VITPSPTLLRSPLVSAAAARALTHERGHRLVRAIDIPARDSFCDFLEALSGRPSDAPTQCRDWTVHHLLAHLAAGSAEIADLAEGALRGLAPRATQGFTERESPYLALPPSHLRRRFVVEAMRATAALLDLRRNDLPVDFTGVKLSPTSLAAHAEAELVLHRWDLTGDDDVSIRALSRAELVTHAVSIVATMRPNVMPFQLVAGADRAVRAVLRADGQADVILADGSLRMGEAPSLPVVTFHPAARALALWGRRSTGLLPEPQGDSSLLAVTLQALGVAQRS